MTLGDTPMKPNPNPCHHVYVGWALSDVFKVGMLAKYIYTISVLDRFGPILPFRTGVTKG